MEAIQQTGAVAAVLALLLLTLWWLRRRGVAGIPLARHGGVRRLQSLESLRLGPQHALHLIRLDGSALLISSSPSGCTLIHRTLFEELDRAEKAAR
jgi:flagellar biogenesis protein FliO